ncbi:MAG: hypothetical protein AAGK32_21615, partial [Actinomycetota bacterium]
MTMRLNSHEIVVVDVPLPRRWMGFTEMRHVVLRLRTDDGLEGLGWAFAFDQRLVPALVAAVDAVVAELHGSDVIQERRIRGRVARMLDYWGNGFTRYVEAMIDIALHDLRARAAGVSVAALLGADGVETVPVYASQHLWRDWDLADLERGAGVLVDEGWRAMKFRIGANEAAVDEAERAR